MGDVSAIPPLRSAQPAPLTVKRVPVSLTRAIVDCAVYVDGHRNPGRCTHAEALETVRGQRGFLWLGLHEPDEEQMSSVAETFGLHKLAAEDAVHAHQRPKLERYDDVLFLVLRTVNYVEHKIDAVSEIVQTGEIMVFVGPNFVITVRHGDHTGLAGVRHQLEARPELLAHGPGVVMHAIADHVVDSYIDVCKMLERDVEAMEEAIFTPGNRIGVEPIYQLKREIVEMRRAVNPLAQPLASLTHNADLPIPKEVRRYLRDVADHHTAVAEQVSEFDESLSALISAALAKIGVQQNTDMRKISAWVAIAAVPTMVAGIYGMNFEHMPELKWSFGYYLVLVIVAVACTGMFVTFRRNNWL